MRGHNSILCLALFLGLFAVFAVGQVGLPAENVGALVERGLIVERVTRNTEADKAGVQPEDILLKWTRGDMKGDFRSPFDLPFVRFEQASRGGVRVEGLRGSEKRTWLLGAETWGIAARPNLQGNLLSVYRQGQDLILAGKHAQAAELWRATGAKVRTTSFSWLEFWFLARAGQELFDAKQWSASDDLYRDVIRRSADADPIVRAELLRQWASGYAYRRDFVNAEICYQEMLSEWRKLGSSTMVLSHGLLELGLLELEQGRFARAEEFFLQSLAITQEVAPTSFQTVVGLTNLGVVAQDRGDLAAAEKYYRRSLTTQDAFFPQSSHLVQTLSDLGTLAQLRGDLVKAETLQRRALAIAQKLQPDSVQVADVLDYIAQCLLARGDTAGAEKHQRRALSIRETAAPGGLLVASSLGNLGRIARVRGEFGKAEGYYRQALDIAEKLDATSFDVVSLLIGAGDLFFEQGDLKQAEQVYQRALAALDLVAPASLDHAETLAALAGTKRRERQFDEAEKLYRQALDALEDKTAHLGGVEGDRSRYRAKHAAYYQEYMDLLLQQAKPDLAFQVLEGSRARTLLETLSRDQINVRGGEDATLLDRERALHQLLNEKSQYRIRLLNSKHSEEHLAAVDAEVTDLLDRYQQVKAETRAKSPRYSALTQPQPLSLREIQQLLDSDTILLEYSLGKARSYVWVVSESSLAAYELPKRADIERMARRVYDSLTARNHEIKGETEAVREERWARADAEYPTAAAALSQMILSPVAPQLPGKRLLIVSDGALHYIPFAALPVPKRQNSKQPPFKAHRATAAAGVPLALEHEVVNLPSLSVVAELRRGELGRQRAAKSVAVLADPVFDSTDERVEGGRQAGERHVLPRTSSSIDRLTRSAADVGLRRNGGSYLGRLLYTRQEAEAIMAVIPPGQGLKALDFQASRAMATSPALAKFRIVHFATHGLLDSKHPELSGLVLSMVNKQGKPQDGFLQLEDIYNLNLPVELVVLSACDTGLGEEISGEGIIGLTRGFMYAGASRVMASLWSVNDEATSELMSRFYKAVERDKMRPAEALRAAQIQMWKQKSWQNPYYWASFQIQGEWR